MIHAASHKQRQLIACSATFSKNARKRIESLTTRDGMRGSNRESELVRINMALRAVKMCYRLLNRDTEQNEKATKNSDNDDVEIENNNNGVSIGDDMRLLEENYGMCIDIFLCSFSPSCYFCL